jgi:uncharacterized protein (DUF58 family)
LSAAAASLHRSPVGVELPDLIRLKAAGETIRLATPRVRAFAVGGHLSPFKGRGVEFDESRPYQAGDDLRTIDWRVTARTGKPHTKVFREERNRPVIVWLDLRQSMMFATRGAYKAVVAAEAAALVGWSAIGNGDQLGGLVFSETDHEELRPRLGRRAALRLLQQLVSNPAWQPSAPGGGDGGVTSHALLRLTRVARPGSMMFLMSDFQGLDADFDRHIRQLASHGDLFLVHIYDAIEMELPPPGRYRIQVGNRSLTIETSDEAMRERYRKQFEERSARLQALARLSGVTLIRMTTSDDPHDVLLRHFARK